MSFFDSIEENLKRAGAYADKNDWRGITSLLSWDMIMELHGLVIAGQLLPHDADQIAMLMQYRAFADLMQGDGLQQAIENLNLAIDSKAYSPGHCMMFHVHAAQCQWQAGDKTRAYGHSMLAIDIANTPQLTRRDRAITDLVRCVFGARDLLAEGDVRYRRVARELRGIARDLRPSRRYGDSWDLRRQTFIWLSILHQYAGNRLRAGWYKGRAGRARKLDLNYEMNRPIRCITPTLPHE